MVSDTYSLNRSVLINEIEMGYYVDVIDYSHNNYLLPIFIIRERDNITNEIKYEAIVSAVKQYSVYYILVLFMFRFYIKY